MWCPAVATARESGVRPVLARRAGARSAALRPVRGFAAAVAQLRQPLRALPPRAGTDLVRAERRAVRRLAAIDRSRVQVPGPARARQASCGASAGRGCGSFGGRGRRDSRSTPSVPRARARVQPVRRPCARAQATCLARPAAHSARTAAGHPARSASQCERARGVCAHLALSARTTLPRPAGSAQSRGRPHRRCDDDGGDGRGVCAAAARGRRQERSGADGRPSRGRTACSTAAATSSFAGVASMTTHSACRACRR